MNGKFQFDWIISIIEKDEQGLQIELADLGNGKHMIVATDLTYPISNNTYRQAGFGPFIYISSDSIIEQINILKDYLLKKRVSI